MNWRVFPNWIIISLSLFVRTFLLQKFPENLFVLNLKFDRYWCSGSGLIVGFLCFWCPEDITHILTLTEQYLIRTDLPAVIGWKLESNMFCKIMVYCWNLRNIWFYFPVVYLTTLLKANNIFFRISWCFVNNSLK